jgi:hypothetical protein
MESDMIRAFFVLAIFSVIAAGCAGTGPARSPSPQEASSMKKTQSPSKPQEAKEVDGETFRRLATKMDEYQDLMATCDNLARTEQNQEIRGSCDARLKALRQELLDLTNSLQDPTK